VYIGPCFGSEVDQGKPGDEVASALTLADFNSAQSFNSDLAERQLAALTSFSNLRRCFA
jgi:hypothetical protein